MIKSAEQKKKKKKTTDSTESLRDLGNTPKRTNVHTTGVQEGKERSEKSLFKEIMAKTSQI